MNTTHFFLMAAKGGQPDPTMNLVFMLAMIGVLYFFMIRPQMKKAKEQKSFVASINPGDTIVTIAGIHGKIIRENEDGTIAVEIDRNTIVKMERSAISMEMTKTLQQKNTAVKA